MDALEKITLAAITHRRPVVVTWMPRYDGADLPLVKVQLGDVVHSLAFDIGAKGFLFKAAMTGIRTRTGLGNLLAAIEIGYWQDRTYASQTSS